MNHSRYPAPAADFYGFWKNGRSYGKIINCLNLSKTQYRKGCAMAILNRLLSECIRDVDQLTQYLQLNPDDAKRIREISERYPFCVPPYYLGLIDPEDPDDPIRRICIPGEQELSGAGMEDTSGEGDNTVIRGMQHKYRQTALILTTNQCAMYCRFCFRKRMVGYSENEMAEHIQEMAEYVSKHTEINNVLLSGGDALVNTNSAIEMYLKTFSRIPTLDFIRIGTRTPVVLPMRIYEDEELLHILEAYNRKKQILIVTHFNHPHEITPEAIRAVNALIGCGCIIRNQTVLLKGVSDDPKTLAALLNRLVSIGVIPYYVFQCRPARGALDEFQIPLLKGSAIVEEAKTMMNGQAKSIHYCMSHITGKIEILGTMEENRMLFKYHQAKYPEDASRIFVKELEKDQCWL